MNKPTEQHIERYVLNPDSLSESERAEIRYWIEIDEQVKEQVDWLTKFYADSEVLESDLKTEFDRRTVSLVPASEIKNRVRGPLVLSAFKKSADTSGIQTISTYISGEKETVFRLLWDLEKDKLLSTVISNNLTDGDPLLVDFDGTETGLVTRVNEMSVHPQIEFKKALALSNLPCTVKAPLQKGEVALNREGEISYSVINRFSPEFDVIVKRNGSRFRLQLKPKGIGIFVDRVIIETIGGSRELFSLNNGELEVNRKGFQELPLTLWFYS